MASFAVGGDNSIAGGLCFGSISFRLGSLRLRHVTKGTGERPGIGRVAATTVGVAMNRRLENRVVLVTGAARGQGRAHCLRLADEGADVIALDACADNPVVRYPMPSSDDLAETRQLVEQLGRRCVTAVVDVRDEGRMLEEVTRAVTSLGRLDVVVANAGICTVGRSIDVDAATFGAVLDVNLTGAWTTCRAALAHLSAGASIILISSSAGMRGLPFFASYSASKQGLVGLMQSLALELADRSIRVNTVHPTGVATVMTTGLEELTSLLAAQPSTRPLFLNALPVDVVDEADVAAAVAFLASDDARHITGLQLTVDAGMSLR